MLSQESDATSDPPPHGKGGPALPAPGDSDQPGVIGPPYISWIRLLVESCQPVLSSTSRVDSLGEKSNIIIW